MSFLQISGISKRSGAKVRLCGHQLVNAIKLACDYSGRGKRSVQAQGEHSFANGQLAKLRQGE